MGSSGDAARRRSRSAERSHSRSHRDREREGSRSSRRSRSRSTERSERRRRSPSRSVSRGRSPSRRTKTRSRSRSHDAKKRSRRRERSASSASSYSSYSSSSDESSSDSDSDGGSRKRSSKHRSKKKKSKHSKKEDRKKKHKKKDKKKDKKKRTKHSAVNQNEYGKYGILRESDFHAKSQSFQAWLRDIKKITEFNGPKWEAMEMFKEYMEDFNTATLPHEKYYDIEKYDMEQYQKQQRKRAKAGGTGASVVDEDALRRERHAQKLAREQDDFKLVLQTMDREKIEAMRRQEQLRAQMQMHYKAGDVAEARRLEQLLRADEDAARKR